jgi:hypothetical protein
MASKTKKSAILNTELTWLTENIYTDKETAERIQEYAEENGKTVKEVVQEILQKNTPVKANKLKKYFRIPGNIFVDEESWRKLQQIAEKEELSPAEIASRIIMENT